MFIYVIVKCYWTAIERALITYNIIIITPIVQRTNINTNFFSLIFVLTCATDFPEKQGTVRSLKFVVLFVLSLSRSCTLLYFHLNSLVEFSATVQLFLSTSFMQKVEEVASL